MRSEGSQQNISWKVKTEVHLTSFRRVKDKNLLSSFVFVLIFRTISFSRSAEWFSDFRIKFVKVPSPWTSTFHVAVMSYMYGRNLKQLLAIRRFFSSQCLLHYFLTLISPPLKYSRNSKQRWKFSLIDKVALVSHPSFYRNQLSLKKIVA